MISPLIALIEDQITEALIGTRDLRARHYDLSAKDGKLERIKQEILNGEVDLLFMSPEAFRVSNWAIKKYAKNVNLLVVDEAHCISAWGHNFRPAFRELNNLKSLFPAKPILALTATASEEVKNSIIYYLKMDKPLIHRESMARPNLRIKSIQIRGSLIERCSGIIEFIREREDFHGVIFCSTREGTKKVAKFLQQTHQLDARFFNAELSRVERSELLEKYRRSEFKIIVATIAFGMGINEEKIRWIVHLNMPASIENYVQEIGRAGRNPREIADCLLVHSYGDFKFRMALADKSPENYRGVVQGHVRAMDRVANQRKCRHRELLQYFELEAYQKAQPCGDRCDVCCDAQGRDVFSPPMEKLHR